MARITHYDQGDVWQPQATFTVGGVATDPTTITVKVKNPAGTITTIGPVSGATGGSGITRVSAGVFKIAQTLDAQGYWFARFEGTGTAAATEDQQAIVDPSEFYDALGNPNRALVGLAETKDWLQQQNIDTANDLELARVINDVSDRFHQEAEREFKPIGTNPATRTFEVMPVGVIEPHYVDGVYLGDTNVTRRTVKIGDLTTLTSVAIYDRDWTTLLSSPSLSLVSQMPLVRQPWEPVTAITFHPTVTALTTGMRIVVTGTWGFPAVPGNVRQAVLDAVASIMDRDVTHYRQDLGMNSQSDGGTTIVMGSGSQRMISLPPSALSVAWSYRVTSVG